ncbi:MAG: hemolysin III family protein [gamma proteobacterium symbiont of Taylorina sp.]|nr:hemolysin III family protein [gamma proteobacterium symbiont of Taylorina sp.]
MKAVKFYSPLEEKINIISHASGLILSIIALILLVTNKHINGNLLYLFSFGVFGISLIVLYAASTFYHNAIDPVLRNKLRIIDHASIYVLIAGTYTPFTLITLNSQSGLNIFYISWIMAFTGIILKIFFTGKYQLISTLIYIFMGWMIVFAIEELVSQLSSEGLFWLVSGGLSYTLGAILYGIKRIKFNHAIFHIFVLIGSFSHFIAVRYYIL